MKTFYDILGVSETAEKDDIQKAYRRMAKMYHPDTVSGMGDKVRLAAEEEFKKINAARGVLLDAEARTDYNRSLGIIPDEEEAPSVSQENVEWGNVDYDYEVKDINTMIGSLQSSLEDFNEELRDTKERTQNAFNRLEFGSQEEAERRWKELRMRDRLMVKARNLTRDLDETLTRLEKIPDKLEEFLKEDEEKDQEVAAVAQALASDDDDSGRDKSGVSVGPKIKYRDPSPYRDVGAHWKDYMFKVVNEGVCPFCDVGIEPEQVYCHSCGNVF